MHYLFDAIERLPTQDVLAEADEDSCAALRQYLAQQARLANAHLPETLASQLCFMAKDIIEKQRQSPSVARHAKLAASALIKAQTEYRFRLRPSHYAMAASLFLIAGAGSILLDSATSVPAPTPAPAAKVAMLTAPEPMIQPAVLFSPKRTAETIAYREKMREGRCQFPEAIAFSETERGIYLRNVVHGEITPDLQEQEISNRLREFVRCDYTPMLMKNSVS